MHPEPHNIDMQTGNLYQEKKMQCPWQGSSCGIGRTLAAACLAIFGLITFAQEGRAQVEYMKVCDLYGAGYFYIPGTTICQDARQIAANQNAISALSTTAFKGVAISTAMVSPFMPSTANFAISAHWANFAGQNALGLGGLMRVNNSNFFLSGGIGIGTEGGTTAQRAGFMFAW